MKDRSGYMNVKIVVVVLIVLISAKAMAAEDNNLGLGVVLGEPTGITAKYLLSDDSAIDAGAGWETSGDDRIHIYADYLLYINDLFDVGTGSLPLYFGAGIRFISIEEDDDELGIRLPVGLEYVFPKLPIRVFGELVPVLDLTPDTEFDLDGGVGIRYSF
jgi:hypothetical protein